MSSLKQHFACPNCDEPLTATAEDVGKTASCPSCDWLFVVPKLSSGPLDPAVKFFCYHCNAKLSATKAQIGKEIPCPDRSCGKTVLVPDPDWDEGNAADKDPGSTRPVNIQELIRAGEEINRRSSQGSE